jgi:glutathione S-transferase
MVYMQIAHQYTESLDQHIGHWPSNHMKLYFSPGACSLAPHALLIDIGRPFDLIKVDTAKGLTAQGQRYSEIAPKGAVPLLELDNGEHLSEGVVICQYLCDQAARTDLMPAAGTMARYRVMEWQNYITSELHKSFSPLFNSQASAETKALFAEQLQRKFSWISSQLANRTYLTGDTYTAADAYLFVVASWAAYVQLDLTDHSHLLAFMERVKARPAMRSAMKAEGLLQ